MQKSGLQFLITHDQDYIYSYKILPKLILINKLNLSPFRLYIFEELNGKIKFMKY